MRLTIFLLTAALTHTYATGKAQNVSISGKNLTLEQVFTVVKKQTGYVVFSNKRDLTETKTVDINVSNLPLNELLDLVLKDQPLEYTIKDKTIILSRRLVDEPAANRPPRIEVFPPPVTGRIMGPDGPLSGVTIVIKGTSKGTNTIGNGTFSLEVKEGDVLEISSIGYTTVTLSYANGKFKMISSTTQKKGQKENATGKLFAVDANSFSLQMMRSSSPLDEVEITAYGSTSKRLSTGSISTVKAADIEKQPVMTLQEALIGRVPGAVVTQLSGNSAAPMQITIRGRNSINPNAIADPLYVIDDIPITTLNVSTLTGNTPINMGSVQAGMTNTMGENPLLRINPRDIERIDVLKDADATAIYGSRGANGVIKITLKKSKAGPGTFSINIDQATQMLERYPHLLGTEEYLAMRREAFRNEGTLPNVSNAPDLTIWDSSKFTDWQRLFVGTGSTTRISANVSGGTAQSNYNISGNFTSNKAIMNNSGKNQVGSLRTSFGTTSTSRKFTFNFSNNFGFSNVAAVNIGQIGSLPPNAPDIYAADGTFNFVPYRNDNGNSFPFSGLRQPSESKTFSLVSGINLKYEFSSKLSFSLAGGFQYDQNDNIKLQPASAFDPISNTGSTAIFGKSTNKSWNISPGLKYITRISKGNLQVQLIANMQSVNTRGETVIASGFPNESMMKSYVNVRNMDLQIQQGYKEYKYIGTSAIINYNWNNKYILNLNGTRDGSSRFAPGNQFGLFGSVGLSWIASEEEWIKNAVPSWISFLKLTGSYGTTGNDGVGEYQYLTRWSKAISETGSASNVLYSYHGVNAFHVIRPLNQEFRWESNRKSNLALNIGFLEDKLNADISVYRHISSDQLTTMPTPKYTGFSSALTNFDATVENKGIEAMISAQLINTKNWSLRFNFNIGSNRNVLLDFPNLDQSSYRGNLKIGASTSAVTVLKYTGIDPMTGNYTVEDKNKDGRIYAGTDIFPASPTDDRYLVIDQNPKYSGGCGFALNYKTVTLSTQFYFINKLRQDPYLTSAPGEMRNIELPDEIKNNHWKQPGDLAKYPRYSTQPGTVPIRATDAFYINGSYMRLNNLALNWRLPENWIKKIKMKNASISIQTQNLYTLSKFKGLDPEINETMYRSPVPRTINTNLSITF